MGILIAGSGCNSEFCDIVECTDTGSGGSTATATSTSTSTSTSSAGGSTGSGGAGGAPPTVEVSIHRLGGGAVDGAKVLSSDGNGDPVGALGTTALDGTATMVVSFGGRLSVFVDDGDKYVYSAAVTQGTTQLTLVHAPPLVNTHTPTNVALSVPCPMCVAGDVVRWSLPCELQSTTVTAPGTVSRTVNGYVGCPGQAQMKSYAVRYNAAGSVLGFAESGPVMFSPTSIIFPQMSATATPGALSVSVTPTGVANGHIHYGLATMGTDQVFNTFFIGTAAATDAFSFETATLPNLSLFTVIPESGGTGRYRGHFRRFETLSAAESVSFANDLALPTAGGSFDGSTVTYAFDAGPLGDATQVHLASGSVHWLLIEPALTSGAIPLPAVPLTLILFEATAGATVFADTVDAAGASSYEAVIAAGVAAAPKDTNDTEGVRWASDVP